MTNISSSPAPASKPKAYSYLRFSTPEQIKGDSRRRQLKLAEDYASRYGLELDQALSFQDLGVSAYKGANAETGQLGTFLEAVRLGIIAPGSYLLVESLDRISRDKARKAIRKLEEICEEDIVLVTLSDGKKYTAESLDEDPMSFMWAFMVAMRAHEESAMKARRLRAAWDHKRAKAAMGDKSLLTTTLPEWMRSVEVVDERGVKVTRAEIIPERGDIIRRIFSMALQGAGLHAIARTFNQEGIPSFRGKGWHRSYIAKVISNPATVGTFVPHVMSYAPGSSVKRRTPLDPIHDFYPAVITNETFDQLQAMRIDCSPLKGKPAPTGELTNILAGLARCPQCGSTMTRVNKGNPQRGGVPKYVCTKAKRGLGCPYVSVPLPWVEEAIRQFGAYLVATAPRDAEGSERNSLESQLDQIDRDKEATQLAIKNILKAIEASSDSVSSILLQRLQDLEDGLVRLTEVEQGLLSKLETIALDLIDKRLEILGTALQEWTSEQTHNSCTQSENPLPDRNTKAELNAALRCVLSSIVLDYQTGQLLFNWKHGPCSCIRYAWPAQATGNRAQTPLFH